MSSWFGWGSGTADTTTAPTPTPSSTPAPSPPPTTAPSRPLANDGPIGAPRRQRRDDDSLSFQDSLTELKQLGIDFEEVPGFKDYLDQVLTGDLDEQFRALGLDGKSAPEQLDRLLDGARASFSTDVSNEFNRHDIFRDRKEAIPKEIQEEARRRTDEFGKKLDGLVKTFNPNSANINDNDSDLEIMRKKTQNMFDMDKRQWDNDLSEDELDHQIDSFVKRVGRGEDFNSVYEDITSQRNQNGNPANRFGSQSGRNGQNFDQNGSSSSSQNHSFSKDPDFDAKAGIAAYRSRKAPDPGAYERNQKRLEEKRQRELALDTTTGRTPLVGSRASRGQRYNPDDDFISPRRGGYDTDDDYDDDQYDRYPNNNNTNTRSQTNNTRTNTNKNVSRYNNRFDQDSSPHDQSQDESRNLEYANDLRRELEYQQDPDPANPFQRKRDRTIKALDSMLGNDGTVSLEQQRKWRKEHNDLNLLLANKGDAYPATLDGLSELINYATNADKPLRSATELMSGKERDGMDPLTKLDTDQIDTLTSALTAQLGANPMDKRTKHQDIKYTPKEQKQLEERDKQLRQLFDESQEISPLTSLPRDLLENMGVTNPKQTQTQKIQILKQYDHLDDNALYNLDPQLLKLRYENQTVDDLFDALSTASDRPTSLSTFDKSNSSRMRKFIDRDQEGDKRLEELRNLLIEAELEEQGEQAIANFKAGKYTYNPDGTLPKDGDVVDLSKYKKMGLTELDATLRDPDSFDEFRQRLSSSEKNLPPALRSTAPAAAKKDDELDSMEKKLKALEEQNSFYEDVITGKKSIEGSKYDKNDPKRKFGPDGLPIEPKYDDTIPISPEDYRPRDFETERDQIRNQTKLSRLENRKKSFEEARIQREAEKKERDDREFQEWREATRQRRELEKATVCAWGQTPIKTSRQEEFDQSIIDAEKRAKIDKLNAAKEQIEVKKWREQREKTLSNHDGDDDRAEIDGPQGLSGAEQSRRAVLSQYFGDDDDDDEAHPDSQKEQNTSAVGDFSKLSHRPILPQQPKSRNDLNSVVGYDDPSILNASQEQKEAHLRALTTGWDESRGGFDNFGARDRQNAQKISSEKTQ